MKKSAVTAPKKVYGPFAKWVLKARRAFRGQTDESIIEVMCEGGRRVFDAIVKLEARGMAPKAIYDLFKKKNEAALDYLWNEMGDEPSNHMNEDLIDDLRRDATDLEDADHHLLDKAFSKALKVEVDRLHAKANKLEDESVDPIFKITKSRGLEIYFED